MAELRQRPFASKKAEAWVRNTAGDYVRIPGVATITADGGEAGTEDVVCLEETFQETTSPPVASIAIDVPAAQFTHSSMDILADAYLKEEDLTFRFQTVATAPAIVNDSVARIKIASATGIANLETAGGVKFETGPMQGRIGYGIKIGTDVYMIDSVTDESNVVVYPRPAADIGGSPGVAFEIVKPRLRLDDVVCAVSNAPPGNWNIGQQATIGATIGLAPKTRLGKWKPALD